MNEFAFPTNIKQIGSIGEGQKIYIEDYAYSYLQQYAEVGGYEERLAFLVGRNIVIDGEAVLFISGLVKASHTAVEKDIIILTDKSWQNAREEINKYFKGLDIVGWMQSQPGYGIYLNAGYANAHKKMFTEKEQVLFVMDPAENLSSFYTYVEKQDLFVESLGYFIYYDKNRGMHEYMLDNKISKMKLKPLPLVSESAEAILKSRKNSSQPAKEPQQTKHSPQAQRSKEPQPTKKLYDLTKLAPLFQGEKFQAERNGKPRAFAQRRFLKVYGGMTAVFAIITISLGIGYSQNNLRIKDMQDQLTQINTAYRDLVVKVKGENVSEVFATQVEPLQLETNEALTNALTEPTNEALTNEALTNALTEPTDEALTNALTEEQLNLELGRINEISQSLNAQIDAQLAAQQTQAQTTQQTQATQTPVAQATPTPSETAVIIEENGAQLPQTEKVVTAMQQDTPTIPKTYTVQSGDTLGYISFKFYGNRTMMNAIMEANGIDDPDTIYFGKVLKLPNQ